jgi:hypothetical protein
MMPDARSRNLNRRPYRRASGVELPKEMDGRTVVGRHYKALVAHYGAILGDPTPSEADAHLIRRCAAQALRLEEMDAARLAGPFLNGYVRPDVIHQLLLRDDLTWAIGKIGQNIQRPIPEGKHSTVAPQHPLANRKLKRAEPQLPVN